MRLQVVASCLLGLMGAAQAQEIVPLPAQLERNAGEFALTSATRIVADGAALAEALMLRDYLRPATGFELPVGSHEDHAGLGTASGRVRRTTSAPSAMPPISARAP